MVIFVSSNITQESKEEEEEVDVLVHVYRKAGGVQKIRPVWERNHESNIYESMNL